MIAYDQEIMVPLCELRNLITDSLLLVNQNPSDTCMAFKDFSPTRIEKNDYLLGLFFDGVMGFVRKLSWLYQVQ